MSGHHHGPPPTAHPGSRYRGRLAVGFALIAVFFVVELAAGLVSGSLALLSDAGHMAADVVALGAALAATRIAGRPDTTGRRTYGSYRAEIFASGLAVLLMIGVGVYVVVEAVGRLGTAPEVDTGPMIVVGLLGLAVNVVVMLLLRDGSKESLGVRGAYLEVMADAAGSVGVVVAGVLVATTGAAWWDTAVALAIGAFIGVRAVMLGRQVLGVLGQQVPEGFDVEEVARELSALDGVEDVHDLHVWVLTSGMNVATAHLVAGRTDRHAEILDAARDLLREAGVEHATLQLEQEPSARCHEITW